MNRKDRRREKAKKRAGRDRGPVNWPNFDPQAVFEAAIADRKAGRLDAAEDGYRQILSVFPENAGVNVNLAIVLRERGRIEEAAERYDEAIADCRRAIELAPGMVEALNTLGAIHQAAGDLEAAERAYQEALAETSSHAEVLTNLGSLEARRGNFEVAIQWYGKALAVDPAYGEAHLNRGIALRELERFEEAAAAFRRVVEIDPHHAGAQVNLGTALAAMCRTEAALACYEEALALAPNLAEAHLNRGNALRDLGRLEGSIASYREALAYQPESVDAHFNLALALLAAGDFEAGWKEHEWRWRTENLKPIARDFDKPQWDGSPLGAKSVLVWNEQGIGDEIMYSLCLTDMLAENPEARLLLECDGRLAGMFRRTYPRLTVLGRDRSDTRGNGVARPDFDFHIPLGSLQQHFRNKCDDFPAVITRLRPDPEKLAFWRQRLDQLGDGLKVGIAWRGGVLLSMKQQKSVPLEILNPILNVSGIQFVNLQYGDCADDLAATERTFGITIHDWPDLDPIEDIESQAALIANLDLVIQTSNASAHLAGALNVPVWILVSAAPNWRWGTTGETCLWYPSMRVFRQPTAGDWKGLAQEVTAALRSWVSAEEA